MTPTRILAVDDNRRFVEKLRCGLERERSEYEVEVCYEAGPAKERIAQTYFDLLILDLKLPRAEDGVRVLIDAKTKWGLPTIMLSTEHDTQVQINLLRGEWKNIMKAGWGADDYMTKPSDLPLLAAHIDKVLENNPRTSRCLTFTYGDIQFKLNPTSTSITEKPKLGWVDLGDDSLKTFTIEGIGPTDIAVLHTLLLGRLESDDPIPNEELMKNAWGKIADDHSLVVAIARLRDIAGFGELIENIRSEGYRLSQKVQKVKACKCF